MALTWIKKLLSTVVDLLDIDFVFWFLTSNSNPIALACWNGICCITKWIDWSPWLFSIFNQWNLIINSEYTVSSNEYETPAK